MNNLLGHLLELTGHEPLLLLLVICAFLVTSQNEAYQVQQKICLTVQVMSG